MNGGYQRTYGSGLHDPLSWRLDVQQPHGPRRSRLHPSRCRARRPQRRARGAVPAHPRPGDRGTPEGAADDAGGQASSWSTKAIAWLESNASLAKPEEPPAEELRTLMNMATEEEMRDLEFEARRELPAFKDFPLMTSWDDGERPEVPEDFLVAIVGSGFSGLAIGRPARAARHPLRGARAPPGARRHLDDQPLPRHPRRHDLDHLRVRVREGTTAGREYFGRGAEVRAYLDKVSKKYGAVRQHPLRIRRP